MSKVQLTQMIIQKQMIKQNLDAQDPTSLDNQEIKLRITQFLDYLFNNILLGKMNYKLFNFDSNHDEVHFNIKNLQHERVLSDTQKQKNLKSNFNIKLLCQYLKIIEVIIDNMNYNRYRTKREIYYTFQEYFEQQDQVDFIIQRLSFLLQVPRRNLYIISATKGLVAGSLILQSENTEINLEQLSMQGKGLNITEFMDQWSVLKITGKYILVVEKETIYHRILDEGLLLKDYVIITGKGYPCHSTQAFLKQLSVQNQDIPIFYIGDWDPHGFDILFLYSFGSQQSMYERNNVAWINWLKLTGFIKNQNHSQLTAQDKKLLENFHRRSYFNQFSKSKCEGSIDYFQKKCQSWLQATQEMMEQNRKYELESLVQGSISEFIKTLVEENLLEAQI